MILAMDVRRSTRIATSFWVAVEGVDGELTRRIGDVSGTGIYFETERDVGGVGTVQWLHVMSSDRAREIRVMAYVVRTIALEDVRGKFCGVALEFMPESDAAAEALYDFVRYALSLRGTPAPSAAARLASRLDAGAGAQDATVQRLSVRAIVLETSWAVGVGEVVKIDIVPPGSAKTLQLRGHATSVVAPSSPLAGYQIEVEVDVEKPAPLTRRSSMSLEAVRGPRPTAPPLPPPREPEAVADTLDQLFSNLIHPKEERPPARALSGALDRVRLPTLCSLFEMERLTGVLTVRRAGEEARLYLRDGQIVDVEPRPADRPARARAAELLGWAEGSFDFAAEPVDRADAIGTRTTALILDTAREDDEARHRGGP